MQLSLTVFNPPGVYTYYYLFFFFYYVVVVVVGNGRLVIPDTTLLRNKQTIRLPQHSKRPGNFKSHRPSSICPPRHWRAHDLDVEICVCYRNSSQSANEAWPSTIPPILFNEREIRCGCGGRSIVSARSYAVGHFPSKEPKGIVDAIPIVSLA